MHHMSVTLLEVSGFRFLENCNSDSFSVFVDCFSEVAESMFFEEFPFTILVFGKFAHL